MSNADSNRQIVEKYWDCYFRKDWKKVAAFYTDDCNYTDVGVDPVGATGPAEIIARLRMGIDPTSSYDHLCRHIVAQGNIVMTEHVEVWGFKTGERFEHAFVSLMEIRDGKIARWHDYSHCANIFGNAPAWWIEHVRKGWRDQIVPIDQL